MLLAYFKQAAAHVYTETNGGIGETLLHLRLSLLSIDMDCGSMRKHFPYVPNSVIPFL